MGRVSVFGAGIAGLALSYELCLRGHEVAIFEKSRYVGGLCRSFEHNGCMLDVGVHIMHLRDKEVFGKVEDVVDPKEWVRVQRRGKLYVKGVYIDWPFSPRALYQLPLRFGISIVCDQVMSHLRKPAGEGKTFHDAIMSIYGPSLYRSFFDPLTRRFLRTDPKLIHSDWAFSSLRAATKIEDSAFLDSYEYLTLGTDRESKKDFGILKFLINSLLRGRVEEDFYYFKNGFGSLTDGYRDKITSIGGQLWTDVQAQEFVIKNGRIRQVVLNGQHYGTDVVVWTGQVHDLAQLLHIEVPKLSHLHSRFVYVFLKDCAKDFQVCYYADEDISFVRATILSNHSKAIIRSEDIAHVVCLEYTFRSLDDLKAEIEFKNLAVEDMKKVGIISADSSIYSSFVLDVFNTYPILTTDYVETVAAFNDELKQFENLVTFGRQATFGYDNADVIIKAACHHPILSSMGLEDRVSQ
jgi:protoporphyrinogen oxidase